MKVQTRPTIVHGRSPDGPQPITSERYTSAAWMQQEYDHLWPRVWMCAGLVGDVEAPGQYFVYDIGTESVIVSRSATGELCAFFNSCQHRGMRVANGVGCSQRFVCGYHGWIYHPDGRLSVVPDNDRFLGGVNRDAHSLRPVRVDTFAGLVFINLDPNAAPLHHDLGLVGERIAPYRLEDMTLVGDQTVTLACNWKAVFDNFGELYHVEHIHPQHQMLFDCPSAQVDLYANGHTGLVIDGHTVNRRLPIPDQPNSYMEHQLRVYGADPSDYVGRILDVRKDVQKLRREAGPGMGFNYDQLSDERLTDIEQYNIFPNTILTLQPDTAIVMRARPFPRDPDWCRWDKWTFRMKPSRDVAERADVAYMPHPSTLFAQPERPAHDEFDQEDIIAGRKTMTITIDQDVHYIRDVQRGMHSRGFQKAFLSEEEDRIQHHHDWLGHLLRNGQ